jgi:acetyl esterase/lipase
VNALTRTLQALVLGTSVFAANAAELECSSSGNVTPGTAAPPCSADQYEVLTNQAYGPGASHLFDLYKPRAATQPLALVVWAHGGGWRSGSKENVNQALRLVCRGYAVASIDYRLSGEATLPSQAHDVKAAVRHLRANAAALGIDPERIALFGSSAGGHLVSLAGTSDGVAALEDLRLGNATTSSRVQAVVDWYGPTDFTRMDAQARLQGCPASNHGAADSAESQVLGCTVNDPACAEAARRANPATYADAGDPPFLIMHGTQDCVVPRAQSTLLFNTLRNAGSCALIRNVNGAAHGGTPWTSAVVQDAVANFLDDALPASAVAPADRANCANLTIEGSPSGSRGATWRYSSTDAGVRYSLTGVLFAPAGSGTFPAVVVSHGKGGSAAEYSARIAGTMTGWGMVAIGTNYTHAPDLIDTGLLPQGGDGASDANVLRALKTRQLLSCLSYVDTTRVAAHGHSMGAFLTAELLGRHPTAIRAASHTAGGATENGPNATRLATAEHIRTPYQLHHGTDDTVVRPELDRALRDVLRANGVPHVLHMYPDYDHREIAADPGMLERVRQWYRTHGVLAD